MIYSIARNSIRSPGDPSGASAPLKDPGRTDVPLPWWSHRCCPSLLSPPLSTSATKRSPVGAGEPRPSGGRGRVGPGLREVRLDNPTQESNAGLCVSVPLYLGAGRAKPRRLYDALGGDKDARAMARRSVWQFLPQRQRLPTAAQEGLSARVKTRRVVAQGMKAAGRLQSAETG